MNVSRKAENAYLTRLCTRSMLQFCLFNKVMHQVHAPIFTFCIYWGVILVISCPFCFFLCVCLFPLLNLLSLNYVFVTHRIPLFPQFGFRTVKTRRSGANVGSISHFFFYKYTQEKLQDMFFICFEIIGKHVSHLFFIRLGPLEKQMKKMFILGLTN